MLTHQPIMLQEVLHFLRPSPGDIALDCTLGGGGHAAAILARVQPRGRLIGLDVDRLELERTTASFRAAGFDPATFTPVHGNFIDLPRVLREAGVERADVVMADLGVSTMQADDGRRGFHYKTPGPLDMRMNSEAGETAASLVARLTEGELAELLRTNSDEPHAEDIAQFLKRQPVPTTQMLEKIVRLSLATTHPELGKPELKMAVRRTFQALRIAVNDEFASLDALLVHLPDILNPGGRVAFLTFHSGEDRRVKHAFRSGLRNGTYEAVAHDVTKSTMAETRANRRASSAKLRWAVRSTAGQSTSR